MLTYKKNFQLDNIALQCMYCPKISSLSPDVNWRDLSDDTVIIMQKKYKYSEFFDPNVSVATSRLPCERTACYLQTSIMYFTMKRVMRSFWHFSTNYIVKQIAWQKSFDNGYVCFKWHSMSNVEPIQRFRRKY